MATTEQAPANERLHIGKPLERQPHSAAEYGTKNIGVQFCLVWAAVQVS